MGINGGNGERSKAHAGKVGTGVLARIAVKQCVGIVHSALFTRPLALWRLAHAAKTTGRATSRRVGILANVANVAARFGPGSEHLSAENSKTARGCFGNDEALRTLD